MWYIIQLLSILIQQTIHVQARVDASAAAGLRTTYWLRLSLPRRGLLPMVAASTPASPLPLRGEPLSHIYHHQH